MWHEPDAELVDLILQGDGEAWDLFLRRFSALIWRIIRRDVGVPADRAEDAFQEIVLRLLEKDCSALRRWRGQASLAGYLTVVFRNAARDFVRTKCPDLFHEQPAGGGEPDSGQSDPQPDPGDLVRLEERRRALEDCTSRLRERDRELLRLRHSMDLPYREIALRLSMTVSNVGVALMRAEERLRRCLLERYGELFRAWGAPAAAM